MNTRPAFDPETFEGFDRDTGFTMVPHLLFDGIMPVIGGAEFKVLCCLYRQTAGYGSQSVRMSLSEIARATGVSRRTVVRSLSELKTLNLVEGEKPTTSNHDATTWTVRQKGKGNRATGDKMSPVAPAVGSSTSDKMSPDLVSKCHQSFLIERKERVSSSTATPTTTTPRARMHSEPTTAAYAEVRETLHPRERDTCDMIFGFACYRPCAKSGAQTQALVKAVRAHPDCDWEAEALDRISYLEGSGRPLDTMLSGLLSQIERHAQAGRLHMLDPEEEPDTYIPPETLAMWKERARPQWDTPHAG